MDFGGAGGPRGRGRGRGGREQDNVSDVKNTDNRNDFGGAEKPGGSSAGIGRGRGRGRGVQPATCFDPSPVTLPENSEDDDFLAAFRRLQQKKEPAGRGRGRGLPFSIPSVTEDSGFQLLDNVSSSLLEPQQPIRSSSGIFSDLENPDECPVIKRGVKGTTVPITANFLRLSLSKNVGIYEYHVDFEPDVEYFRFRKKIIALLEPQLCTARNFDGSKLYLANRLSKNVSEFSVDHPNNPSEQKVLVTIKFVKQNSLAECVHFYNVLFRRIMEILGLVEMKRNFYNHRAVYDIPEHKLEIWPGYVTAIDEYEGGLMVCCDSSFRVLRTSTILEILYNFQVMEGRSSRIVDDKARTNFSDYVLGKIILTRYNNRNYRVDDVDWSRNPLSKFVNSKGQELTFVEYYKAAYNIDIRNTTQPLLLHRPKPDHRVGPIQLICLIPELCYITGMDSSITSKYEIMRDIAVFTRLTPHQRNLALEKFAKNVNENPEAKSVLQSWGLSLEEAAIKLEGRVLTAPKIILKNHDFQPESANFSDKITKNSVFDPIPAKNWRVFFTSFDRGRAQRFVEEYQLVTKAFGISVSYSASHSINVGQGHLRDFREALTRNLNPNVQFIVIIVPSQRDDLYAMIKNICTVQNSIPSQVILSKTLGNERKLRSMVQKIALQINCKIGGSLWTIRIPLPEKIMFIGMDVYHDPRKRKFSVTGVVGTLNPTFTKYYSRVIIQGRHQETVNSLLPILTELLIAFSQENDGFPDRVIMWRDGVSDGQLTYTQGHEVTQILSAFKNFNINPKFTFCVVQKRINARLFLQDKHGYGPFANPQPGTVVDHTITRKYLYDFFLVSQLVRDGTVTPTHYIVLEDNADVPPDHIQKFAFATSFMYYNWSGSIRVPAMCQYAHKLASLVGQHTQAEASNELWKNLYYL